VEFQQGGIFKTIEITHVVAESADWKHIVAESAAAEITS
jgi:hypothetical protein